MTVRSATFALLMLVLMHACRPRYLTTRDPHFNFRVRTIAIFYTCGDPKADGYVTCERLADGLVAEVAARLRARGVTVSLLRRDGSVGQSLKDRLGDSTNDAVLVLSIAGSYRSSGTVLIVPVTSEAMIFDVSLLGAPRFERVWRFQVQVRSSPERPADEVIGALDQDRLLPPAGG